jgi:hypothetical protein
MKNRPSILFRTAIEFEQFAALNQAGGFVIQNDVSQLSFNVSSTSENERGCNIAELKGPAQCFNDWDRVISPIFGRGATLTNGRGFAIGNRVTVTATASLDWKPLKSISSITATKSYPFSDKCQYAKML